MTQSRKKGGRWAAGQSGNPAGRKPGSGEVAQLRAAIAARVPELVESLMAQALAGDVAAARLLLERSIAPLRAVEQLVSVELAATSLSEQARSVLAAAGAGVLAPGQAAQLIGAIAGLAKIIEVAELEGRIVALEEHHAAKK